MNPLKNGLYLLLSLLITFLLVMIQLPLLLKSWKTIKQKLALTIRLG